MQRRNAYPLVFVVDDDPNIICMIEGLLKREGFRTARAMNVAEALRGIRELSPDLILLDVNLPDGTGFDLCRALNCGASTFATPILFISASEDIATKVEGFEVGGVDYITKPIIGAEVIARVRTHLRLRHAHERLAELQAERVQALANAQQDLMPRPKDFPEAHFQVSIRQVHTAGGDFYDVIPAGHGVVDYLVADARGHDLASTLWTAALKTLATEFAGPLHLPIEIVRGINSSLCRVLPPGAFLTLIYARLDHRNGHLTLIDAGHPSAIVVHADGDKPVILRQEGDIVGAFSDAAFGVAELTLQPGDRLFLYTDGLIEANGSAEQGLQRLAGACFSRRSLPLQDVVSAVVDDVTGTLSLVDDTLLVGVER